MRVVTGRAKLNSFLDRVPRGGGAYILVLACQRTQRVRVGRLGWLQFKPGFYLYVGSALGPGGLRARLRHHLSPVRQAHWHCDYLRPACRPVAVWFSLGARRLEHVWAACLERAAQAVVPLPGFGASDCSCTAHLFLVRSRAALWPLRRRLAALSPGGLSGLTWGGTPGR